MHTNSAHIGEAQLISKAREGDAAAFNSLTVLHIDRLFNAVYRMVSNHEDAGDIVQETFLRAFRSVSSFKGNSSFYTWIFSIAINTVISERRRRSPRFLTCSRPGLEAALEVPARDAEGQDPVNTAERCETLCQIQDAINTLDEQARTVVVLRDIDGLNYDEIGKLIGVPVGTVKSRLHRARLQLRTLLTELVQP